MTDGDSGGDLLDMTLGLPWSDAVAFPADPSSATEARHFVRNVLQAAGLNIDVIDNVELVVSELVTNAVLHAATGPTVTVAIDVDRIRVEVRDTSTASPAIAHFGANAATGRGLSVVSRASRDWGFDRDQYGKSVWAEFDIKPADLFTEDRPPRVNTELIIDNRMMGETKLVKFNRVPVALYVELEQANDATLREFELLAIEIDREREAVRNIHYQLAGLVVRSNTYFGPMRSRLRSVVARAQRRGVSTVDLKAHIDEEGVTYACEFASLMSEADALCDRGILLTDSASTEVRQLRNWFVDEMRNQYSDSRPPISFRSRL